MIRSRSVAYHFTVFIHLLDKGNIFRIFQDLFSSFKPNTERNSIRIIATQTESYTNAASMYYSSGLQFLIMCFTRREKNSPYYMQISFDFLVSIWQKGMF